MAWLAIAWLVFIALLAILVPILPIETRHADRLPAIPSQGCPQGVGHLLGADDNGNDMFARCI